MNLLLNFHFRKNFLFLHSKFPGFIRPEYQLLFLQRANIFSTINANILQNMNNIIKNNKYKWN
jgi:hypothetical protein